MTDVAIPTGFPSLDKTLGGGLRPGELVVLGGDAGSGTSSLALAIALKTGRAGSVFLTGEMGAARVAERALAMEAGVPLSELGSGSLNESDEERRAAALTRLGYYALVVESLHRGIDAVPEAARTHPDARVIVVDGLESLLLAAESMDEQLAYAVLRLKRLALDAGVCVVLVTHLPLLDRQRSDRRPRLDDFGARGALAVHADVVLGLYREEIYTADLSLAGATELLLLKRRDGPLGYVDLFFDARSLRFEDVLETDGTGPLY